MKFNSETSFTFLFYSSFKIPRYDKITPSHQSNVSLLNITQNLRKLKLDKEPSADKIKFPHVPLDYDFMVGKVLSWKIYKRGIKEETRYYLHNYLSRTLILDC